jgi:hypothetical protein
VIGYDRALIGASDYDPSTGLTLFGLPSAAPALKAGKTTLAMQASDLQEAKNINTIGNDILPNTAFARVKLTVVNGPALTWLAPPSNQCALKSDELAVIATSTKKVKQVTFTVDGKRVGVDRNGRAGIYSHSWKTAKLQKGKHHLVAMLVDAAGRKAAAGRTVRVCK